jgi:fucose 4-O-acetylase-like acetyltransferase
MDTSSTNKNRIEELDFLKCIFIVLMVMFHLVYFSEKHLMVKQFVYTFHMPAFLLLSGYLVNVNKNAKSFFRGILWLLIPYALMETAYTIMAAQLPIREHIDHLTLSVLLTNVFLRPIGPYWYLHTLITCEIIYYAIFQLKKLNIFSKFIVWGTLMYLLSLKNMEIVLFANALYFMIGALIRQSKFSFLSVFQPSFWSAIPLFILCFFPQNFNRATIGGMAITFLIISLLLAIYRYLPGSIQQITNFVGRNTLVILLFSPIFTMLSKSLVPMFSFDASGTSFAFTATILSIAGCFGISYLMDTLKFSRFLFGKEKVLN